MKRARIAIAISLFTAGCTALIGVPDLELQDSDDGGVPEGSVTLPDGNVITPGVDGSSGGPGTDSGGPGTDSAACGGANLQTDNNNCGTCGRSCQGQTCQGGQCQPPVLADGLGTPYAMTSDATYLYYTIYDDPPSVQRVKKDGSAAAEVLTGSPFTQPIGIQILGNTLYFGAREGVFSCDVTTGATTCVPSQVMLSASVDDGRDLVISNSLIYWGDYSGAVFRMQLDGGARVPIIKDLNGEGDGPFKLAIGGGNIYVTSYDAFNLASALIDGGAQQSAGYSDSLLQDPYVVADDTSYAYTYIDFDSSQGNVIIGDNTSLTTKPIASTAVAAGQADGVALDSQYVYWTDSGSLNGDDANGDGMLKRCPRTGCVGDPTVLATGMKGGGPIIIDGSFAYVVENNNQNSATDQQGRIRKIALP